MSLPSYAVDFRGHAACPCQAAWLPAFEAEAQRRGLLAGPLPISQLIGGYSGSGGTHASGGAADFYPLSVVKQVDGTDGLVWLARQMGADATWHRRYNWDGAGGVEHVHSVLRGCPHNGPARYQLVAVDQGFNGLGHLGQSAGDDGPRPLSGRTWQQGIEWARQQEDDMPYTEQQLRQIVREEATKAATAAVADQIDAIAKAAAKAVLDSDVVSRLDVSVREALRAAFNDANKPPRKG